MKGYAIVMVGLAGLFVSTMFAKAQMGQMGQMPNQTPPSNAEAIRQGYNTVKGNILKAADKMPDNAYDFHPVPEERSFGGWVGHVADAQTNNCSRVLGALKTPSAGSKTSKADLVSALKESFDTCDAAYAALTDANANEPVQTARGSVPRLATLAGNVAHDNECYGSMAVYMRLKGVVPPSSEPRK